MFTLNVEPTATDLVASTAPPGIASIEKLVAGGFAKA
jgi:hypothetical protein